MANDCLSAATLCPNCLQPDGKHRPWCGNVKTSPPAEVGDIVEHPVLGPAPLLSVYSRNQALAGGELVDCTQEPFDELNRNAGIKFDVALTAAVFHRYVEVPEEFKGLQDLKG